MHQFILSAVVKHGDRHGRQIGFPTINLDSLLWPKSEPAGVYACRVTIAKKTYLGALYFGPRSIKGETQSVLEINLLDFAGDVYGQTAKVELGDFIRSPIEYSPDQTNEIKLQQQIKNDILLVRKLGNLRWSFNQ